MSQENCSEGKRDTFDVSEVGKDLSYPHLVNLKKRSCVNINMQQQEQVAELLREFEDVFV